MLAVLLEGRLGKTREIIARHQTIRARKQSHIGFSGHAAEHEGTMGLTALSA